MRDTSSPRIDRETAAVVDHAVESLAAFRGLMATEDPGVRLHLLSSLEHQIRSSLTTAAFGAREHDYGWEEIAELLGSDPAATRARFDAAGADAE